MAARELLMRVALAIALTLLLARGVDAAGPWKGQVVDRDTGKPIAGAVVVMIWEERSPGVLHPQDDVHSAIEVVTDEDGRFVIRAHDPKPTKVFGRVRDPYLKMFRRGYGLWDFKGGPYYPLAEETPTMNRRLAEGWKAFAAEGVVIELVPLSERQKRLRVHSLVEPSGVPPGLVPHLLAEIEADRRALDAERRR